MQFPNFNMRDMVNSQQRLVQEKFGITKLITVIGASMGGMQALQWAVSYPDIVTSIVPIIPLGRTPAWSTGVMEMLRQSIMSDPRWKGGNYAANEPPEAGMRLWAGWLSGVIVRTPGYQEAMMPNSADALAYLKGVQDGGWKRMDATDWVYQSLGLRPAQSRHLTRFQRRLSQGGEIDQSENTNPRRHRGHAQSGIRGARSSAVY